MNAREVLKHYFGYESFRPGQERAVDAILSGRDVLAIMPTGAGKSVCYQVPALVLPGMTLVISPLISLMQDQVKSLNEAGIHAGYINSSLTERQISKVYELAGKGTYKILYVAPERLGTPGFLAFAEKAEISMVTVDEAHCISQWGQDFRPSYLRIVDFVESLQTRPVVSAFTATATEEVRDDILCCLHLSEPEVVVTGFNRENLYFSVETVKRKDAFVLEYIKNHAEESGIIYCGTRKNVDMLHEKLLTNGVLAGRYHAGMESEERREAQEDFIYDRTPVIVATNAFGMGINKSNVRYVMHYNMPQSMENYYQEAGRAGRDGIPAQCVLLFSAQDVMLCKYLLDHKDFTDIPEEDIELIRERDQKRLRVMEGYCRTTECLRNYILRYFGEDPKAPCENCANCEREYIEVDMTDEARQVVNCVYETKGRFGQSIVLGTLLGANRARLREVGAVDYKTYGRLRDCPEEDVRALIGKMLMEGYLVQTEDRYSVLRLGDISPLKRENARVVIRKNKEKEPERRESGARKKSTDNLTKAGYALFDRLRQLRLKIAKEEAVPPYIVFSDKTLIDMCERMPGNRREMLLVSGVGAHKFEKYGERFLREIELFSKS